MSKQNKSEVIFPKSYLNEIRKNKKQRIYDCFTFYNELDLLEIRLRELYNEIDYIVLAEATKTFSGKDKPLYFNDNKKKFRKWEKKIIHIIIDNMPKFSPFDKFLIWLEKFLPRKPQLFVRKFLARIIGGMARYKMIEFQRRCLLKGLKYANDEDIILGIDVDEIPNPKKIKETIKALKKYKFVEFEQQNFRYFLNGKVIGEEALAPGTRACKFKSLKKDLKGKIDFLRTTPYLWRKFNNEEYGSHNYYKIRDGGWHFSYIGDVKNIIKKLGSVSHPEFDKKELKDPKIVKNIIKTGKIALSNSKVKYIKIDKSFPKIIQKNKKIYSKKKLINNEIID